MLKRLFSRIARGEPPAANLFPASQLQNMLKCYLLSGEQATRRVSRKNGDYAVYTLKNRLDRKTLTADVEISIDGEIFKSHVTAELVTPGTYAVRALTLDNRPEKMLSRQETVNALKYIGREIYSIESCDRMPEPHNPASLTFGRLPRAAARFLS